MPRPVDVCSRNGAAWILAPLEIAQAANARRVGDVLPRVNEGLAHRRPAVPRWNCQGLELAARPRTLVAHAQPVRPAQGTAVRERGQQCVALRNRRYRRQGNSRPIAARLWKESDSTNFVSAIG